MRSNPQNNEYPFQIQYLLEKTRFSGVRSATINFGLFNILLAYPRIWTKKQAATKIRSTEKLGRNSVDPVFLCGKF